MTEWRLSGRLAVIGHPVAHSLSPRIHNAALRALGREPVYEAVDIPAGELEARFTRLLRDGFEGFNVTIPHKERIVPLLDRLDASALRVGAVNTVRVDHSEGRPVTIGYNTDIAGFVGPLAPHRDRLRGGSVLVWGAGGAARAVIAGVHEALDPAVITVAARRTEAALELARDLARAGGDRVVAVEWPAPPHAVDAHDLLVNTTPLGMHPHPEGTPAPDGLGLRRGQVVYDLVYRPRRTRLLADALAAGADPIGGLPMLIGQAAVAFRLWTGVDMPLDAVHEALQSVEDPS